MAARIVYALSVTVVLLQLLPISFAFSPPCPVMSPAVVVGTFSANHFHPHRLSKTILYEKISEKRRKQLGIEEGEDEYDLGRALEVNTDPLISKIVAGSFILVMITLLVVGVVIPYTTDYGEGVCNPLLTGGRC